MTTMYDIAREAGVSQTAVSFVLNRHPRAERLNEATREKVLVIAKKLNYRPNLTAKSLSTGKSHSVGLVIPAAKGELMFTRIAGFERFLRENGYMVNLLFTDPAIFAKDEEQDKVLFDEVMKSNPAGVAFFDPDPSRVVEVVRRLKKINLPYITMDIDVKGIDSIFIDRSKGVYDAVRYLYERGYERIAYLGIPERFRMAGYEKALDLSGRSPVYIGKDAENTDDLFEFGRRSVTSLIEHPEKLDAVQCYSDDVALGVLAGLHQHHIRIPTEMAVVGFNGIKASAMSYPALTTIAQPQESAGRLAAEILLKKINGEIESGKAIREMIDTTLIVRHTT